MMVEEQTSFLKDPHSPLGQTAWHKHPHFPFHNAFSGPSPYRQLKWAVSAMVSLFFSLFYSAKQNIYVMYITCTCSISISTWPLIFIRYWFIFNCFSRDPESRQVNGWWYLLVFVFFGFYMHSHVFFITYHLITECSLKDRKSSCNETFDNLTLILFLDTVQQHVFVWAWLLW